MAALFGYDCDGVRDNAIVAEGIHGHGIIEQPPSPQAAVDGLAGDGKALGQQFLGGRLLGPQFQATPGLPQLGVGERRKVVASNAGQQGFG